MRRAFVLLAFLLLTATAFAQVHPINPDLLTRRWPAAWIAPPNVPLKEYGVFHFRKTIELPAKPTEFVVHVSADNRYQLFVNGQFVGLGPARGDVAHWRFETLDLAPFLKPGKNTLAAVVWNFGPHAPLAQMSYQTGFIVQGNGPAEAVVNTGSDGWKVIQNLAYTPIPWGPVAKLDTYWYFVVGPTDDVDAARYPWGWQAVEYDDSSWQKPRKLAQGKTDGVAGDVNWNLVPRTIPMLEAQDQPFAAVRRATNLTVPPDFLSGKTALTVPANTTASVLLDQGVLTTAYPRLLVSGGKGSAVKLAYAEALFDSTKEKKNRNRVEGMQFIGFDDRFRPDGGSQREFQPLWYRTFRYVQFDVQTGAEPLLIHRLDSRFTAYPFEENARFSSSDPSLKPIWDIGWRTARLCANETYMDCPYYEQLQYIGDTRIQALVSLYVSGDDRLVRNAIQQFNHSRIPEGITQSRYPSELVQITPTFALAWVLMVHDYWMHRDDEAFVRQFLPGIRGVLDWFETQVNAGGLVNALPYYDFFDSQYPLHEIARKSDGRGMTVSTLYFAQALDHAVALLDRFGKPGEAGYYRQLSAKLKKAVFAQCYDPVRGLFADSPTKTHYSQHANTMAVLTDALPAADQPRLMRRVLTDTSLLQAATYFQFYNALALRKAGLADAYLPSLGPWHRMVAQGLSTFAEWEVEPRSDCHAWSASPNYYFLSLVAGVVSASPGFRTVRVQPALGPLTSVEAVVPHPAGEIRVQLKRVGKTGLTGEVVLPEGVTGEFVWQGKTRALRAGRNGL